MDTPILRREQRKRQRDGAIPPSHLAASHLPLHKGGFDGAEGQRGERARQRDGAIPPSRLAASHLPLHKGGFGGVEGRRSV